jgi:hypothetical protein
LHQRFSIDVMQRAVEALYRDILIAKAGRPKHN